MNELARKRLPNKEFNEIFRQRTKKFALNILIFIDGLPFTTGTKVLSYQLGKSATSIAANFRAFCRGRSQNERFSKICIVVEEADETIYWLELVSESKYGDQHQLKVLLDECIQIVKVTTKIKDTIFSQKSI
jgi:four helix bundle protein